MLPRSKGSGAPAIGALLRSGQVFSLFAVIALFHFSFPVAFAACNTRGLDHQAQVVTVFDGDTVQLKNGAKIRFIAINTPEIGRDGRPDDFMAVEAKAAVISLLKQHGQEIGLQFGRDQKDRYGRLLAHIFLKDGTNLTEWLLQNGYGATIAFPPNLWGQECYLQAEERARKAGKGIWKRWPLASSMLPERARGFYVLKGKVVRIGNSRKSIWLNLPGNVGVRVARKDLHYFRDVRLDRLKGRVIMVRGWLYPYKKQHVMRIRHSSSLKIMK
jgi:endonuclease YncB( thermonuclease family)